MWHLLMAHQQESFLSFSSQPSLSCCLSRVAKRSTPKPHGLLLLTLQKLCDSLPSPPKLRGPLSMAAMPRFKSQRQSSSAAPFPTPPTISYTCQHFLSFQLYGAAIVSLGRCGPVAWRQSSPSAHAGPVNRGSYFPVPSWVEFGPILLAQSMVTAI